MSRATETTVGITGSVLWVLRSGPAGERLLLFNPGSECTLDEVAGRPARRAHLLLTTHAPFAGSSSFEVAASSASIFALDDDVPK